LIASFNKQSFRSRNVGSIDINDRNKTGSAGRTREEFSFSLEFASSRVSAVRLKWVVNFGGTNAQLLLTLEK
jgi:hypothetical protein